MRKITLLELFNEYERLLSAYMKANGKFVVIPPENGEKAMVINDLRNQVQDYRKELLNKLISVDDAGKDRF